MKTIIPAANEHIVVQVEGLENVANKKLVFIAHGFASFKEHYIIRIPAEEFLRAGYTVVTFDGRYGFGESSGPLDKANITTVIEDLNSVIEWAKTQPFYTEPFSLVGHSLGGGAALSVATTRPETVDNLILLNSLFSGKLLFEAYEKYNKDLLEQWKREPLVREKVGDATRTGTIGFQYMTETLKYDFVRDAFKITAPTLIITGDKDKSCPPENCRVFLEALPVAVIPEVSPSAKQSIGNPQRVPSGTHKKLVVVPNCGHFFSKDENKVDLAREISDWLRSI